MSSLWKGSYSHLPHGYFDDARILNVGDTAATLLLRMSDFAHRNETDGILSDRQVRRLGTRGRWRAVSLERLDDEGLIERTQSDDGWRIVDWLDAHRSAAEIAEIRTKRARAGRKGGSVTTPQSTSETPVTDQSATSERPMTDQSATSERAVPGGREERSRRPAPVQDPPGAKQVAWPSETETETETETEIKRPPPPSPDIHSLNVASPVVVEVADRLIRIVSEDPGAVANTGERRYVARALEQRWAIAQLEDVAHEAATAREPRRYLLGCLRSRANEPPPYTTEHAIDLSYFPAAEAASHYDHEGTP